MKYVRLTALLGVLPLLLLMLTGCTKEDTADNKDKAQGITLALTIPASESALTKATTVPLPGENTLSNVYVFFYPNTGGSSALPSYFYEGEINEEKDWTYNIPKVDLKTFLTAGVRYEVYVVASLPATTTKPTNLTKKDELLAMVETQFDRSVAPFMSFSGRGEVTYVPNISSTVEIPLRRTVARLDVTLAGLKTGQSAELKLIEASATPYFEKERLTTSEFRSDMLKTITAGFYRAYIYENYTSGATTQQTQLLLTVKNSDGSTSATYLPIVVNNGVINRNKIYDIQLTIIGDRLVVVNGDVIEWAEVVGGSGNLSPLPTLPKANSYIVAPGGDAVFIPVSQVIDANTFDNTIPLIGNTENLTAELVWTDTKGATLVIADDASIAEIAAIGVGPNARLMVKPGSTPGNSVVAIKGEDGKIKWSWHIWVTDYNPEAKDGQHTINATTFMDRNLGAMAYHVTTPELAGNLEAIGMFYEWGRKDPFPKPNKWSGTAATLWADRVAYNANGFIIPLPNVRGGSVSAVNNNCSYAFTVENPYAYISADGNWNWIIADQWKINAWGEPTNTTVEPKTPYDPCPPRWRVATSQAYTTLASKFSSTNYRGAVSTTAIGGKVMYFPSNGYLVWNSTSSDEASSVLFSARSTANNSGTGFFINSGNKGVVTTNTTGVLAPASACNIRCIKE